MIKVRVIHGEKQCKKYKKATLEEIVGETLEAIGFTTLPGAWGNEPCFILYFSNGKRYYFLVPTDTL